MTDGDSAASPNARLLVGPIPAARTSRGRIGNALSVSLLTHAAGIVLVAVVMSRPPVSNSIAKITGETPSRITWIAQGGLKGGGRGNARLEPARRAEVPGREALTVPVSKPALEPNKDPPKLEQQLQIPAVTAMAGVQELPGIISALTPISVTDPGGAGAGGRLGSGPGIGPGFGPGRYGGTGGDGYEIGNGVVPPRLIREIKPGYTPEAMRARIQGMVTLQAVVLPDGSVGTARVIRSLDSTFGLDQEAVKTVKLWRFTSGTLAGRAVPVVVEIELTFTLR
jgi:periplasmic protein TonB